MASFFKKKNYRFGIGKEEDMKAKPPEKPVNFLRDKAYLKSYANILLIF